jgi:hypothetical protein
MKNTINVIPINVGGTSSNRRKKYALMKNDGGDRNTPSMARKNNLCRRGVGAALRRDRSDAGSELACASSRASELAAYKLQIAAQSSCDVIGSKRAFGQSRRRLKRASSLTQHSAQHFSQIVDAIGLR